MKKLLSLVLAIAMVVSYMPLAYAGESAELSLKVTFVVDQDLQRIRELKDHVSELEERSLDIFYSIYVDRNGDGKVDYKDLDIDGDGEITQRDIELLHQAIDDLSYIGDFELDDVKNHLNEIAERRPDLQPQIEDVLDYVQKLQDKIAEFIAMLKSLEPPIIAIQLEGPNPWVLENVKLGETRSNYGLEGLMHRVINRGNVPVEIEIGYGIHAEYGIHPGLEQGKDTFVTKARLGNVRCPAMPIPPNERLYLGSIRNREEDALCLEYLAPTELSEPFEGMETCYELRAYSIIDTP